MDEHRKAAWLHRIFGWLGVTCLFEREELGPDRWARRITLIRRGHRITYASPFRSTPSEDAP